MKMGKRLQQLQKVHSFHGLLRHAYTKTAADMQNLRLACARKSRRPRGGGLHGSYDSTTLCGAFVDAARFQGIVNDFWLQSSML